MMATATGAQRTAGPAWLLMSLGNAPDRQESRRDVLDTPILPGSVMKAVALVAALEHGVIQPGTTRICRRVVTVEGRRYACSHPDLKRPLTAAEALAHSCNDFFASLVPALSLSAINDVRARVGLQPLRADVNRAAALVGLDGPRVTPRALLEVFTRLAGFDRGRSAKITESTRRVLLDGLRGAATYGSASELGSRGISALAKTGTAPMPGGGALGLALAFTPAERPQRGIIVVAPGAAGRDATSMAGDLLAADEEQLRIGITDAAGRTRVEAMTLEDYVARVVAGEGQPRAPHAMQQALAVAARTFAMANRGRHSGEAYDLCDTTHCQVIRRATESSRRAALITRGRVLTYKGLPATVFYSAWCGGRAEVASAVWPGAVDHAAVEAGREDDGCRDEPGWTSEIRAGDVERALRAAGLKGDRLREIRVVQRSASGRVSRLRAEGFTPAELTGENFRLAVGRVVGWQHLKSTAFELRRTAGGYAFTGRGSGHGVGMCVIGASRRAGRGATAEDILRFYYPGLAIEQYSSRGVPVAAASTEHQTTDVLLALPGAEESERSIIVQLVRRARDEIATRTGTSAPPTIRVTVHPTVESFTRATGQAWWASGATNGSTIDLLPIAILRRQAQLERTIHHEVAHVVIDHALEGKPLWVREGAASYFADTSSRVDGSPAVACPTDTEFRRSTSAAAYRDAYTRAEACFRRQLESDKTWREVR